MRAALLAQQRSAPRSHSSGFPPILLSTHPLSTRSHPRVKGQHGAHAQLGTLLGGLDRGLRGSGPAEGVAGQKHSGQVQPQRGQDLLAAA